MPVDSRFGRRGAWLGAARGRLPVRFRN